MTGGYKTYPFLLFWWGKMVGEVEYGSAKRQAEQER